MSAWQNALSGAASGAGTGALLGSPTGPFSALTGAVGGGLAGGLAGYFGHQPDEYKKLSTQTGGQQDALQQLLQNLQQSGGEGGNYQKSQDYLGSLLDRDPGVYDRFAEPYMRQFQEQTVPGLANRFAGLGGAQGGGALSSSGFGQAVGGAGAQLQSNLAGLFAQLQGGAANQAMGQYNNLANQGLGRNTFENIFQRGTTGPAGALAGGLAQGAGQAGQTMLLDKLMKYLTENKQNSQTTGIPETGTTGIPQ